MSELRVRNMDDWVIAELKAQAKAHGRSLEADLRDQLEATRREMLPATRGAFGHVRWSTWVLSALALGVAGLFAGLALRSNAPRRRRYLWR